MGTSGAVMELAPPAVVWGVFTRLLGIVYLIGFASLWGQILPLAGSRGITPVEQLLGRMRRDLPLWRCVTGLPTVLWVTSGDRALRGIVLVGGGAAVLAVVGGEVSRWALLICWVAYLSLDVAADLMYPWDCMLFEAGFLALFLPPLEPLPSLAATAMPLPIVALGLNLLLVRVLWGFGKFKFAGLSSKDFTYLREFLINQPIPSPLGWYAHRLPARVHKLGLLLLFVAEILAPPLALVSGPARLAVAASTAALMVGIQVMGNFGYFNVVVLVLCVPLFDLRSPIPDLSLAAATASWSTLLVHAVLLVVLVGGLLHFPFNSWCARGWVYWPATLGAPRPLRTLIGLYRALMPFRIVHPYGVFPAESTPGIKFVPVVEGSADGENWREYEYRYYPCHERSRPRWVAPHHPRLDHLVVYEGYGTNAAGFLMPIMGSHPYMFSRRAPFVRMMARLADPESPVRSLFKRDPFAGGPPPRLMRTRLFALEPTTPGERAASGRWWRRHLIGTRETAFAASPAIFADWLNGPELFHWDHVTWRRQAPTVARFEARARAAASLDEIEAAIPHLLGASSDLVVRFWRDLIPSVQPAGQADLRCLPTAAESARRRLGCDALTDFERVAAALALGLGARLDERVWGDQAQRLKAESYFHVGLLIHALMLRGRDTFERAVVDPALIDREAARTGPTEGLWLLGIFRGDVMAYHARAHALTRLFVEAKKTPMVPGFLQLQPLLAASMAESGGAMPIRISRAVADGAWCVEFPQVVDPAATA
jgi:hypothetical protein